MTNERRKQLSDLADHHALLLLGVPKEQRPECLARLIAEHRLVVARNMPGTSEEQREKFIRTLFAVVEQRMRKLALKGGSTGGTA